MAMTVRMIFLARMNTVTTTEEVVVDGAVAAAVDVAALVLKAWRLLVPAC